MFKFTVALLLVASVSALPGKRLNGLQTILPRLQPKAGAVLPTRPDGRIIGGTQATAGQFPYQANIVIDNLYFCGASLIAEDWIMTAAHCADNAVSILVTLGDLNRNTNDGTEQETTCADIYVNEEWRPLLVRNDIALCRLSTAATLTSAVGVGAISASEPATGERVTLSGWGKLSDNSLGTSANLMWVDVTVADYSECLNYYGTGDAATQICFTAENADGSISSSCNGDSGGPMSNTGLSVIYGVTSYGSSQGCESGAPGAYTKVSAYLQWIEGISGVTP